MPEDAAADCELIAGLPPQGPALGLVWTAIVDVGEKLDLGKARGGHRFLVPILGGRFHAGPAGEGLSGEVLAGGADRQFLRADGVKELDAVYEMRCHDGTVISLRNRVIVDEAAKPGRYAISVIEAAVDAGRFDWLNRRVLLGTLHSARPVREAVIIRAWLAG